MLISSHLIFADILYEETFLRQPFAAPILQFKFGNVKPDLNRKLVGGAHYHYQTYNYLANLIQSITTEPSSPGHYVENCGIATHLVADYFCKYHFYSKYHKKSIIEHTRYEYNLHRTLLKMKKTNMLPLSNNKSYRSITEVFNCIAEMQSQYIKLPDNPTKDIVFALQAGKMVLNSIITMTRNNTLRSSRPYKNAVSYE